MSEILAPSLSVLHGDANPSNSVFHNGSSPILLSTADNPVLFSSDSLPVSPYGATYKIPANTDGIQEPLCFGLPRGVNSRQSGSWLFCTKFLNIADSLERKQIFYFAISTNTG